MVTIGLFSKELLSEFLKSKTEEFTRKVNSLLSEEKDGSSKIEILRKEFLLNVLEIDNSGVSVSRVRSDNQVVGEEELATHIKFFIPFSGSSELLSKTPNERSANSYQADLNDERTEIIFTLTIGEKDGVVIRQFYNNFEKSLLENIRNQRNDIDRFNYSLKGIIDAQYSKRDQQLHIQHNLIKDIGLPERK